MDYQQVLGKYFSDEYETVFATDIGNWDMTITNTVGEQYKYEGSICCDFSVDGVDLSDLMRDTLDLPDLSEKLVLDRESETLEHIQRIGSGCIISRKYYVQDGVAGLLDDLDADSLFDHIVGNDPDVVPNPLEIKDYEITVNFKNDHSLLSMVLTTSMDCQVIFQDSQRIF